MGIRLQLWRGEILGAVVAKVVVHTTPPRTRDTLRSKQVDSSGTKSPGGRAGREFKTALTDLGPGAKGEKEPGPEEEERTCILPHP